MGLDGTPITFILLAANVLASFIAFSNPGFLSANLLTTNGVRAGEVQRVLTSGFIHGSGAHLLFNMLTLFFFGPYLEQMLGPMNYLLIYFGSLIGGSAWALVENWKNPNYAALGASGAISGVIVSFCVFEPFAMLYIFFAIPMPAIVFAVLYIAFSAAMTGRANKRIAHEAHLGGALAGLALTLILVPGSGAAMVQAVMDVFS
jgi:membrane associated rhomboid family serine protease